MAHMQIRTDGRRTLGNERDTKGKNSGIFSVFGEINAFKKYFYLVFHKTSEQAKMAF